MWTKYNDLKNYEDYIDIQHHQNIKRIKIYINKNSDEDKSIGVKCSIKLNDSSNQEKIINDLISKLNPSNLKNIESFEKIDIISNNDNSYIVDLCIKSTLSFYGLTNIIGKYEWVISKDNNSAVVNKISDSLLKFSLDSFNFELSDNKFSIILNISHKFLPITPFTNIVVIQCLSMISNIIMKTNINE